MSSGTTLSEDEEIEFKYEGAVPQNELISYKNMMLEMNHSAVTDGSCLSLVAVAVATVLAIFAVSILINLLAW
jgi:hypothetical protein